MTNTTHHLSVQQLTTNLLTTLTHATEHQDRNAYLAALATCHTAPTFDWAGIDTLAPRPPAPSPASPTSTTSASSST